MHGTLMKGLAILVAVSLLTVLAFLWLLRPNPQIEESAHTSADVLDRVAERTLRESQVGTDPIKIQAPPYPARPEFEPEKPELVLPQDYVLAEHQGAMQRAPLTRPADIETAPNPNWLNAATGIDAILDLPRRREKDQVSAVLRLAPGVAVDAIDKSLADLGASIQGTSSEFLRIGVTPNRALLQAIADLPGVLGLGTLPAEAKLSASFAEALQSSPASSITPVFITLMHDDASGRSRQALTELGVTVGDYDADLRSYTANLPAHAFPAVAAADFVMRIEPVTMMKATHASAVPVMGVDGLRRYDYAGETFAGLTGRGMAVGVLDTGLNLSHPDITRGRSSICGANFVDGETWDLWTDLDGHGTHVFGTIAGAGRLDPLFAGMAPNLSHLRFGKVLHSSGYGSGDDIRRGMDYLSRPSTCPGIQAHSVKPLIVNMSLGESTVESSGRALGERKLDAVVYSRGQLYVVAQSNEGETGFSNFGTAKNALAVGAVHDSGIVANFSSHGPTADGRLVPKIVGTGVEIWSARGSAAKDGHRSLSGTSMASPSVAGVAALLLEADANLRQRPAVARARLMATAVRPDAYLASSKRFPLVNSQGPGSMQNQYGMGLVSARSSVASLDSANGWLVGSIESRPTASGYEYIDVQVPEGASRLDVVMTWDEGPADTLTNSVFNNLDLWLDQGADCGEGACGEHASRSKVDNLEWVIVPSPTPGTHRIKVVPVRVYGQPVHVAVAWKIIRGQSTPQLRVNSEQIASKTDPDRLTLRLTVETSGYLAAGTTLHFSCSKAPQHNCEHLSSALGKARMRVIRQDGLIRERGAGLGGAYSLGEVAPRAPRSVEIQLSRSALPVDTPLQVTASSWNARSATRAVLLGGVEDAGLSATPANDDFDTPEQITGESTETPIDLSRASREPGEPGVQGSTRSLWYAWQAPEGGLYRFRLTREGSGEPASADIDIFTGEKIVELASVAAKTGSEITFAADAGTPYLVRLSTNAGITPKLVMTWEAADVRPANDDFANAAVLSGESGSTQGSNEGATLERGEFWNGAAASTWHTWTAPSSDHWQFNLQGQDMKVMVFVGETVDTLRLLSTPSPGHTANFWAMEGQRYAIAIAAPSAETSGSSYTLSWRGIVHTSFEQAHLDRFVDAGTLSGSEGSLDSPYLDHLTAETHEPPEAGIGTRWWRWKAPKSGRFTFSVDGPDGILLSLFAGSSLDKLVVKASGNTRTRLVLDAEADQTYSVSIGRSMDSINIPLVTLGQVKRLVWGEAPLNDDRANASLITGTDGSVEVDLRRATSAPGEPLDNIGRESLWWRWSAPSSGWHRFAMDSDPSWAIMSIYPVDGDSLASSHGAELRPLASSERSFLASGRVESSLLARAGTQYQIRVAKRPNTQEDAPTHLRWQRIDSGPAYLGYLGTYNSPPNESGSTESRDPLWTSNFAMHPDGTLMFATLNGELLALDRSPSSGELSSARSIASNLVSAEIDTGPDTALDREALSKSILWWSRAHNRLFVFSLWQNSAFALNRDGEAEWSHNFVQKKISEDGENQWIPLHSSFAATPDEQYLYFAEYGFNEIQVYRLDSASAMTHITTHKTISRSDGTLVGVNGKPEIGQMLVTPQGTHLIAASEIGLLIFSIDPANGRLTLVKEIGVGSHADDAPFKGFRALGGLVLNIDEALLFVTGKHAPQVAVFDVSSSYVEPLHLYSLTEFSSAARQVPTIFRRPSTDAFSICGRAHPHADLVAIDVICVQGSYVALWDKSERALKVTDYGLWPLEDRFGGSVTRHGDFRHHAARSPDGKDLYRVSPNGERHEIQQMRRAGAMIIDTSSNHAPSINRRLENQVATVGAAFRYQIAEDTFTDVDGDPLELNASGLPTWLTFDAMSRTFSGTPSVADVTLAPEVVEVTVSDPEGASARLRFGMEVRQASKLNTDPVLVQPLPALKVRVGETFTFELPTAIFRDPDGDQLFYTVVSVPFWLDWDPVTNILTGTPTEAQAGLNITLTYLAEDGHGGSAQTGLRITVEALPEPLSFQLTSETDALSEWDHKAPIEIRLELAEALVDAHSFEILSTGSAELGADFLLSHTNFSIEAGAKSARFSLTPLLDLDGEGEETITLEVQSGDGGSGNLSIALEDAGALFADAKSTIYSDIYVLFGDRTISADSIGLEVLVCNFGARRSSPGRVRFSISQSADLLPRVGPSSSLRVQELNYGWCITPVFTVDLTELPGAGAYYAIASMDSLAEELPGRDYTNEDVTGFSLTPDMQVRTTCPDLGRNTSPGAPDPLAGEQWHIENTGQAAFAAAGGKVGEDLDMDSVIGDEERGEGIKVAVVDTGLEVCHPDLSANVEPGASFNFNTLDWFGAQASDPYFPSTFGDHGTSVAGLIASVQSNGIGGRGVASAAIVRGYNFLEAIPDTAFNDSLGASSSDPNSSDVDIFNMSLGSFGAESKTPVDRVRLFRHGTQNLRDGKGAMYVKAGGNGFARCVSMRRVDQASGFDINAELGCVPVNADRQTNLPELISIGAFNASGKRANYSASGSALWVTAPGGEYGENHPAMVTTDQMGADAGYDALIEGAGTRRHGLRPGTQDNPHGDYVSIFNGTSSAAPNVSGAIAILLSAYPQLSWREVKYLLAKSARKIHADIPAFRLAIGGEPVVLRHPWATNGAGYDFHNWYGFGAVSVDALLAAAANYTPGSLGPYTRETGEAYARSEPVAIPDNDGAGVTQHLLVESVDDARRIESLTLAFKITHPFTNDLGITLTSPAGTKSVLLPVYSETLVGNADLDWELLSNAFYGESPNGEWTIHVIDAATGDVGMLDSWQLNFTFGNIPFNN